MRVCLKPAICFLIEATLPEFPYVPMCFTALPKFTKSVTFAP